MENVNFFEKLASQLGQSASVKNVFGTPITVGDKTIIPVCRIAYGFGGGFGKGNKFKKAAMANNLSEMQDSPGPAGDEGAGGGGGMYARPKGVYEVTNDSTKFIPANNARQLLIGICFGFIIHAYMSARRRSYKLPHRWH